jgi:hypothetical protein
MIYTKNTSTGTHISYFDIIINFDNDNLHFPQWENLDFGCTEF